MFYAQRNSLVLRPHAGSFWSWPREVRRGAGQCLLVTGLKDPSDPSLPHALKQPGIHVRTPLREFGNEPEQRQFAGQSQMSESSWI